MDKHLSLPVDVVERHKLYLACDCLACRRSMSFDEPVMAFCRGLLVPKSLDCGRYGRLRVYPDGSYTFTD